MQMRWGPLPSFFHVGQEARYVTAGPLASGTLIGGMRLSNKIAIDFFGKFYFPCLNSESRGDP